MEKEIIKKIIKESVCFGILVFGLYLVGKVDVFGFLHKEVKIMKTVATQTMTIIRGGQELEVVVDGWVEWYEEKNYGADADGNRGIKKVFVDEVTDIGAYFDNLDDPTLSTSVELTSEEKKEAEQLLVEKFLEG